MLSLMRWRIVLSAALLLLLSACASTVEPQTATEPLPSTLSDADQNQQVANFRQRASRDAKEGSGGPLLHFIHGFPF